MPEKDSEPALVGPLELIELQLLLKLCDFVLSELDVGLGVLVELVDLLGCNLREFGLELVTVHLVHSDLVVDELGQIDLLAILHLELLSEAVLQNLQDFSLLRLLLVVQAGLNR